MAAGAVELVVRGPAHAVKFAQARALGAWRIDHAPEVEPAPLQQVVLDGKDLDAAVWQPCGVRLLPLRADGVVHQVALPLALLVAELHVRAVPEGAHPSDCDAVFGLELGLRLEVADNVGRIELAEHSRHAGLLPGIEDGSVAVAAGGGTGIARSLAGRLVALGGLDLDLSGRDPVHEILERTAGVCRSRPIRFLQLLPRPHPQRPSEPVCVSQVAFRFGSLPRQPVGNPQQVRGLGIGAVERARMVQALDGVRDLASFRRACLLKRLCQGGAAQDQMARASELCLQRCPGGCAELRRLVEAV